MPEVEFPANGGTAPGYLSTPEGRTGPGVLVFQEWWGVEDHIRDVCDRFAAEASLHLRRTTSAARRPSSPTRRSRR